MESIINELGLTFSAPKCQFIAFDDQRMVKEVESLRLQKIPHTKQLKYLGDHQLSFLPHVEYIHKKCNRVYDKRHLQSNTFGLRYREMVILYKGLIQMYLVISLLSLCKNT